MKSKITKVTVAFPGSPWESYRINTKCRLIEDNLISIELTDDFIILNIEKEFTTKIYQRKIPRYFLMQFEEETDEESESKDE